MVAIIQKKLIILVLGDREDGGHHTEEVQRHPGPA